MFRQLFQGWSHQRVHGFNGIAQRQQGNRINMICVNSYLQIQVLASQRNRSPVKPRRVGSLGCLKPIGGGSLSLLFGAEHDEKQSDEDNSQPHKDSSINNFLHPEHHNFRFRAHRKTSPYCLLQCMGEKDDLFTTGRNRFYLTRTYVRHKMKLSHKAGGFHVITVYHWRFRFRENPCSL